MSLINEALRKVQHERSNSGRPPSVGGGRGGGHFSGGGGGKHKAFQWIFGILIAGAAFGAAAGFAFFLIAQIANPPENEPVVERPREVSAFVPPVQPVPLATEELERAVERRPSALDAMERSAPPLELKDLTEAARQPVPATPPALSEVAPPAQPEPAAEVAPPPPEPAAETATAEPAEGKSPENPDRVQQIRVFVSNFEVSGIMAAGERSKVLSNGRVYEIGDFVAPALGLTLGEIQSNRLVFKDEQGRKYEKRL